MKLKVMPLRLRYLQINLSPAYPLFATAVILNVTTCTTPLYESCINHEIGMWK